MNLAIIQARTSSTRLPGKVLKTILGVPILLMQIERVKNSKLIDNIIVATSVDESDLQIENLCIDAGLSCFRGSLDDVLDRFYSAAKLNKPTNVVRLTADCPLMDPEIIDKVIKYHLDGFYDYTSNALEPTFPDGLDVEVMKYGALEIAWREAKLTSEREHVTPYIYKNKEKFKIGVFKNNVDLSHLRWTVDYEEDFEFVNEIYKNLYKAGNKFSMADVLELLKANPGIDKINSKYWRNDGYEKSLKNDSVISNK